MFRPVLAFVAIALTALVLAPTVQSVHEGVEGINIYRDLPWSLWKWDVPEPPHPDAVLPPDCGDTPVPLYSEVTRWPERIRKDEPFIVGGVVTAPSRGNVSVPGITVELWLNETKELPGEFLGRAISGEGFELAATVPFDLQATRYHLVAHALQKKEDCTRYLEHWSDPEMDVTSGTRVVFDAAPRAVIGRETLVSGVVIDAVGAPVREVPVQLVVDGQEFAVTTDSAGRFVQPFTPTRAGNHTLSASFAGTDHYGGSSEDSKMKVLEEDVELFGATGAAGIEVLRSAPASISGRVYVGPNVTLTPVVIRLEGLEVLPCDGCAPVQELRADPGPDGAFMANFTAPPTTTPGAFGLTVTGGGLRKAATFNGTVFVPVTLHVSAASTGFWDKEFRGETRAVDDAGLPAPGDVGIEGPGGWLATTSDANGTRAFGASAECGTHPVRAVYNGTDLYRPATAQTDVGVCAYMALLPPFLGLLPWWAWALLALSPFAALLAWRRLRERYAGTIVGGPALTLTFTEPRDAAVGIVGVGETAVATAFLESALPDGHTLRIGTHRAMQDAVVGDGLSASVALPAEDLGDLPVRADVLDGKGRVVSRRTATLRVVRYAEEIERRHLEFKRGSVGEGYERVSPREFEAWLRERAPDLDGPTVQRLVGLFEEADYGPRDAGRRELVAYLEAESRMPGVGARAA